MSVFNRNKLISLLYYPTRLINFLNLNKKIIFYHIPRSGGTFIKNILKKNYAKTLEINDFREISLNTIKKNKIVVGHFEFTNLNNFYKSSFTIIRKPNELYNSFYRLHSKRNNKISKDEFINLVKKNNADNILTRIFAKKLRLTNFFFYKRDEKQINYLELNNDDCQLAYDNIKKIAYFKIEELNQILKFIDTDYHPEINKLHKGIITNIDNQTDLNFSEISNLDEKIYNKLFLS